MDDLSRSRNNGLMSVSNVGVPDPFT